MIKNYPTIQEAKIIWQNGIDFRLSHSEFSNLNEYIFHTQGVASAAEKIAEKTMFLNPEKAYVCGLLHDYGKKYDEFKELKFHPQIGYEEFTDMGYFDVARTCLSHSFPYKDFDNNDYKMYLPQWLNWAKDKLKNYQYDDYDRLIQLCDLFFEGMNMVSMEDRFQGIARRYNLSPHNQSLQKRAAINNKMYFDKLCRQDIYEILGIV